MLDLSWSELLFVGALALLILGPRDLPELFALVGKFVGRIRRMYADMKGSMSQLEREVDIASGKAKTSDEHWRSYLPKELQYIDESFRPGTMTADDHIARRNAIEDAKAKAVQAKSEAPQQTNAPHAGGIDESR